MLPVQLGTVLDGLYFPVDSEQVNKPVNGTPLEPTMPYGISYLSEHCI